ncbi:MAG: metallophosphoesterase family protein [Clostridiales bacterium]|nr:metallophosphoesterase family protein [Clostridiales bacterium]
MKRMTRRIVSIVMALVLLVGCMAIASADTDSRLKFNSDGKFKILHITDTHQNISDGEKVKIFMAEVLDYAKPDLVVFGGDNQVGNGNDYQANYDAIKSLVDPIVERGIPFALVFGNHDHQSGISNEEQLEIFQSFPGCLAYDVEGLYGCGNYNLPILSSDGESTAFNLWFFDSGDRNPDAEEGGYDYVREDQINWYKTTSEALERACGKKVPSLVFQHIIVPEIYDIFLRSPIKIKDFNFKGVSRMPIPDLTKLKEGYILEPPCPPNYSAGEFDAWVERGDVIGAVFGHDHVNNFIVNLNGIDLIQTPGACFESGYGTNFYRGARLITLDEKDTSTYDTEVITYAKLSKQEGSKLGNTFRLDDIGADILLPIEVIGKTVMTVIKMVFSIFSK